MLKPLNHSQTVKAVSRLQTGNTRRKFSVRWKTFSSIGKLHGSLKTKFVNVERRSPEVMSCYFLVVRTV